MFKHVLHTRPSANTIILFDEATAIFFSRKLLYKFLKSISKFIVNIVKKDSHKYLLKNLKCDV